MISAFGLAIPTTKPCHTTRYCETCGTWTSRAAAKPCRYLIDSLWAVAASTVPSWFAVNPRRLAAVGRAGGLAMIGVGVSVAVTGRRN